MTAKPLLYDLFHDVLRNLREDSSASNIKIRELNLNDRKDDAQHEQKVLDALSRAERLIVGIIEGVDDDYFNSTKVEVD